MQDERIRPDVEPPAPDVAAVEAVIRRAIDERRRDLVNIIGAGELTIALRWETEGRAHVVKRVPPFPDRPAAEQYVRLVRGHIADLETHGVRCVATTLHTLERRDGTAIVCHSQPLLDPDALADRLLRDRTPSPTDPLVTTLVDRVVGVVGAGVPIDPQFANWYWFEGDLWQLDLSTPFMMTADKSALLFDTTGFEREYPWLVRRVVYKELMKAARPYTDDVTFVLTDVMTQLHRMGLSVWCAPFAEAARARHGVAIDPDVARQRCDADAKFYPNLLRMKRFERRWRQLTGRRYDALLPDKSTFD